MKEKIRRCREHVLVLRGNEPCSFAEHSKNNKIEEMSEQEAEVLDWVEMNTVVEQWKDSEREELWFWPRKHYKTQRNYHRQVVFNPKTQDLKGPFNKGPTEFNKTLYEVIGDNFREIAQLIVEDVNRGVQKENKWVLKKTVYQFCPDAICGKNPCICGDGK